MFRCEHDSWETEFSFTWRKYWRPTPQIPTMLRRWKIYENRIKYMSSIGKSFYLQLYCPHSYFIYISAGGSCGGGGMSIAWQSSQIVALTPWIRKLLFLLQFGRFELTRSWHINAWYDLVSNEKSISWSVVRFEGKANRKLQEMKLKSAPALSHN